MVKPPRTPAVVKPPPINESIMRVGAAVARVCGVAPGSVISGAEWATRERAEREQWARDRARPIAAPSIAWERTHPAQRTAEVSGGRLIVTHCETEALWRLVARAGVREEATLACELTREPTDAECVAWLAVATLHATRIPNAKRAVFGERA